MDTAFWASCYPPGSSWLTEPEPRATVNSVGSVTSVARREKPGWESGCATCKLRDTGCGNKFCLKQFFFSPAYKVEY